MVRSQRNNNPGNLEKGGAWIGLMPESGMTPEQQAEPRFAVFESAKMGFRALAKVLLAYRNKHGLRTVRGIITRWAPPSENNTAAYIKAVCDAIGKEPDVNLDMYDPAILRGLCRAISVQEAGKWAFSPEDLAAGVAMALDHWGDASTPHDA